MWLFNKLVWPVVGYGAEVWGWREREREDRKATGKVYEVGSGGG